MVLELEPVVVQEPELVELQVLEPAVVLEQAHEPEPEHELESAQEPVHEQAVVPEPALELLESERSVFAAREFALAVASRLDLSYYDNANAYEMVEDNRVVV